MEFAEFRLVAASNMIRLRAEKGLTQAELGAALNYSDKSISKWERGESLPDAFVLSRMAELYGVSVDYILTSHDRWNDEPAAADPINRSEYSVPMIIAVSVLSVLTAALAVFVILWMCDIFVPWIFLPGISAALVVYTVLDIIFLKARHLPFALSGLVVSLFVMGYFIVPDTDGWQLFLLMVPAVALVFLGCSIKKKSHLRARFERWRARRKEKKAEKA